MKYLSFFALLLYAGTLVGQDLPTPIVGNPFAQPGIRYGSPGKAFVIEYERFPNYKLQGGVFPSDEKGLSELENKERFEAKIKFPLVLKGNWKVLVDIYYSHERYNFEEIAPENNYAFQAIDGDALKRARLTLYTFRSMSPKNYVALRMETSSNGAYPGLARFEKRYMVYRLAAIFGIKKNEDTEWGFGAITNYGFKRFTAYPFILYNHNFNEKWGLETVLPIKYSLRHNLTEKSLLTMSAEYWSSAYSITLKPPGALMPPDYIFKSSALQFYVKWEKNLLNAWTWVSFRTGYAYNFDSKFILEGTRNGGRINAFPSNSIFFSAGVFLAPPKKFMEANSRTE